MADDNRSPNHFVPLIIFITWLVVSKSQQFHQNYTGVDFSPFAKLPVDAGYPDLTDYTYADVHVMLEVIMEKFSRVTVMISDFGSGPYIWNTTYHKSNVKIYTFEIAAKINRERNTTKIKTLLGIWLDDDQSVRIRDLQVAIECVEKANHIHAGTVEGILVTHASLETDIIRAEQTLQDLTYLRKSLVGRYKLGTLMVCRTIIKLINNDSEGDLFKIIKRILQASDFVVCHIEPKMISKGASAAFESITETLLKFRDFQKLNKNIEVMGHTEWPGRGFLVWENAENLVKYWETAGQWASHNNYTIWFFEAFDNPWRSTDDGYHGWWRLTDNSLSAQKRGYVEKIMELEERPVSSTVNTEAIVSIIVGIVVVLFLLSLIAFLFLRLRKLQRKLSNEDIRQFMEGMSEKAAAELGEYHLDTSPYQFPYDTSFEIKIDRLNILYDQILGKGQFGCVIKAVYESNTKVFEDVAVKMAKPGCSQGDLKGLLSEIKIMIYMGKHPNIVSLRGAYTAELHKGLVYIATELCSVGSLQSYLRKQEKNPNFAHAYANVYSKPANPAYVNTSESICYKQMEQWSLEIACGMEYLGTKHVIHADLATRNVLLTGEMTAKITDFGLSRRMYDYTNYIKSGEEPLPWRWMAIESLRKFEFSTSSDVWSYGITLWEIFTMGDTPYPGLGWTTDFVTMLAEGLRLNRPTYASPNLYQLMVDCWHTNPNERPNFSEIKQIIENILADKK